MNLEERRKQWERTGLRTTSINSFRENPKYFKQTLDGLTKEDNKKFFELGTQTHMYLLEPNEFKNTYIFLDYNKPKGANQLAFCEHIANKIKNNQNINKKELSVESYKLAYKATGKSEQKLEDEAIKLYMQLEDYIQFLTVGPDKEVLNFSTLRYLKEARQTVINHKLANLLMFENELSSEKHYNETFVLWEFPQVTIHGEPLVVKSTIDKLIVDTDNKIIKLVDLKTTNDLTKFDSKFSEYDNYKIQLQAYWIAVETYFKEQYPDEDITEYTRKTYLVALQTTNPYRDYPVNCEVWPISEASLTEGLNILKETLPDLAWHFENDLWDHKKSYYEGNGANTAL